MTGFLTAQFTSDDSATSTGFIANVLSLCSPSTYSASGSSVDEPCARCIPPPGSGCSVVAGSTSASGRACPVGRYGVGGSGSLCQQCPVGRYGNATGLSDSGCSGACVASAGYRCVAGSVSAKGEVAWLYLDDPDSGRYACVQCHCAWDRKGQQLLASRRLGRWCHFGLGTQEAREIVKDSGYDFIVV